MCHGLPVRRDRGGRRLKILNVTDEFTREALASRVGRSIDAGETVKVLAELVAAAGHPSRSGVTTVQSSSPRP
jgi:hypothetical protein